MTDFSSLESALYDATPERIASSLRYLRKADAVMAALMPMLASTPAPPARDETPIDIGDETVPRWVVEYADALHEYMTANSAGGSWAIGGVQSREQAPPAQPRVERYGDGVLVHWPEGVEQYVQVGDCVTGNIAPPAAVPAGYAAAIKAVQEMMPPRDFRPSAQVWLTGNQVNELHARLDAAAMLAATNKERE